MTIDVSRYFWDARAKRTLTVRTTVGDVEELLALLRKLASTRQSVDLQAPNGNFLCVGVGLPDGWASFGTAEMVARGELEQLLPQSPVESSGVVDFFCGGEPTEIRSSALVPFEQILAVAAHFMRTQNVPREMRWG
jgi:hypothetical protein